MLIGTNHLGTTYITLQLMLTSYLTVDVFVKAVKTIINNDWVQVQHWSSTKWQNVGNICLSINKTVIFLFDVSFKQIQ